MELTAEQQQKVDDENARQCRIALAWMTQHLGDYSPSGASAGLMAAYLKDHNLPWENDSLEEAFNYLVTQGGITYTSPVDEPKPATSAPAPVDPNIPPWSSPLTRAAIRMMSVQEMKTHLSDKRFGKQFEQEILNLKITKIGETR